MQTAFVLAEFQKAATFRPTPFPCFELEPHLLTVLSLFLSMIAALFQALGLLSRLTYDYCPGYMHKGLCAGLT